MSVREREPTTQETWERHAAKDTRCPDCGARSSACECVQSDRLPAWIFDPCPEVQRG